MYKNLRDIIYENFNITECITYAQSYRGILRYFSTIGNPRKINGFTYLLNCDCTYELSDGTVIDAKKGDVVYLPAFGEYRSNFKNFCNDTIDGILINLLFTDEKNEMFYLPDNLKIYKISDSNYIKSCFTEILNHSRQPKKNTAEIKSLAYKILSYLGETDKKQKIKSNKYMRIYDAISYLENDIQQSLTVEELAQMCHMTPVHFRKLFKEYSGMSPICFRIQKKMESARILLLTTDMSISEISEYLGFENVSYFSKLFKKYQKSSPSQYRNTLIHR